MRRRMTRDCGSGLVTGFRNFARRAAGVERLRGFDPRVRVEKRLTLRECGGMTRSTREFRESGALWGEETVLNGHQRLANSAQVGMCRERLPSSVDPSND